MPCIINNEHPTSLNKNNIYVSLCGKTVYSTHNPFKSVSVAEKSGKPICRKCRSIAGLPPPKPRKVSVEPYTLYCIFMGEIKEIVVVAETDSNYKTSKGNLHAKRNSAGDVYWRRAGDEAGKELFTKNKEEAIELAKTQLNQRKDHLRRLIEEANKREASL